MLWARALSGCRLSVVSNASSASPASPGVDKQQSEAVVNERIARCERSCARKQRVGFLEPTRFKGSVPLLAETFGIARFCWKNHGDEAFEARGSSCRWRRAAYRCRDLPVGAFNPYALSEGVRVSASAFPRSWPRSSRPSPAVRSCFPRSLGGEPRDDFLGGVFHELIAISKLLQLPAEDITQLGLLVNA